MRRLTNEQVDQVFATSIIVDVSGQKVVMTGTMPCHRNVLASLLEQHGATVQRAISVGTTLLICEDPDSNTIKLKKARSQPSR